MANKKQSITKEALRAFLNQEIKQTYIYTFNNKMSDDKKKINNK